MGRHLIRRDRLGLPQHDYQALLLQITEQIITQHRDEFLEFARAMLQAQRQGG